MPSPGRPEKTHDASHASLQKQIERLNRRQPGVAAVLWVDVTANPPTDGSVFWYVTDESC